MNMSSYNCCEPNTKEIKHIKELAKVLKLISEESRLKILCVLRQGDHCVCEIKEHVGMSQSLISHHLRDLKDAGMLRSKKNGVRSYYSITENGANITNLLFKVPKEAKL